MRISKALSKYLILTVLVSVHVFRAEVQARETWVIPYSHTKIEKFYFNPELAKKDLSSFKQKLGYGPIHTHTESYSKELGLKYVEIMWYRDKTKPYPSPFYWVRHYFPFGYYAVASEYKSSCYTEGNPCDVISGRKTHTDIDLKIGSILLKRHYDSAAINPGTINGLHWRHSFEGMVDNGRSIGYANFFPITSNIGINRSKNYFNKQQACLNGWTDLKGKYRRGLFINNQVTLDSDERCNIVDAAGAPVGELTILPAAGYSHATYSEKTYHTTAMPDGAYYTFKRNANNQLQEIHNYPIQLERASQEWKVKYSQTIDTYSNGNLTGRVLPNRQKLSMEYDDNGRLSFTKDSLANWIQFHYNDNLGQLVKVTFEGGEITYKYDDRHNLAAVSYPDGTSKHYHYEDNHYGHLLTGITDENGNRFATWAYDNQGRAILSEHAGGAERVEFTYNNDGSTTVTDANGAQRTYHFVIARNTLKVSHITGDQCKTCPNGHIQAYTYDSSGFIATETDWEGHITHYTRDPQGRELTRIEAYGTPEARTISTLWNTALNKPAQITYPDRKEIYTYNEQGLLIKTEHLPLNP